MNKIKIIDPTDARKLIAELDAYLNERYPAESNHLDSIDELKKPHVTMFGCSKMKDIIAMGAVKIMQGYGEIKRVYVPPEHRGKKLSKLIMAAIEAHLVQSKIPFARLETGINQPEALSLYKKLGYMEREPFGDYKHDPYSVFMEKELRLKPEF
ncbi:MAG: GNAT family N-acetyltransferase [Desulfobacteraceae bacterium]|jgi:putative acetyltransferase